MKPEKTVPTPANSGVKNTEPIENQPPTLKCEYRDLDFKCWPRPSELELTQLAVQLARAGKINPKQLVEQAWTFYQESCRLLQADSREVAEYLKAERTREESANGPEAAAFELLPTPKKYPVTYPELELLLLPKLKGRTAERAKIMREFLFQNYVAGRNAPMNGAPDTRPEVLTAEQLIRLREESEAELESLFGQLRATRFDAEDYAHFAQYFLNWERWRTGFATSMMRSASARRRWAKRRKAGKAKTGARPNYAAFKKVIEPLKKGLDGSSG